MTGWTALVNPVTMDSGKIMVTLSLLSSVFESSMLAPWQPQSHGAVQPKFKLQTKLKAAEERKMIRDEIDNGIQAQVWE